MTLTSVSVISAASTTTALSISRSHQLVVQQPPIALSVSLSLGRTRKRLGLGLGMGMGMRMRMRMRMICRCEMALKSESSTSDDPLESDDEELKWKVEQVGSKVRLNAALKVYHIPRVPEVELAAGTVGVIKQHVGFWKGKRISANLPYKVQFQIDVQDRGPVKFFAHLKEDEFDFI